MIHPGATRFTTSFPCNVLRIPSQVSEDQVENPIPNSRTLRIQNGNPLQQRKGDQVPKHTLDSAAVGREGETSENPLRFNTPRRSSSLE